MRRHAQPGGQREALPALALAVSYDFTGTNEASFTLSSQVDATTTKSVTIVLNKATFAGKVADLAKVTRTEIGAAINAQIGASGPDGLMGKVQVGIGRTATCSSRPPATPITGSTAKPAAAA